MDMALAVLFISKKFHTHVVIFPANLNFIILTGSLSCNNVGERILLRRLIS